MSKFNFRYLVYPLALSAFTGWASYAWLMQKPDGGFALLVFFPAAILLGLVFGFVVALIQKKYPRIAILFLVIYTGYFGGYIAYDGPIQNMISKCSRDALWEFEITRDVALMDSWCIKESHTVRFLIIAEETLHDAETLTAVVEKIDPSNPYINIKQFNLECPYLKIAVATGDLKSIQRLMDEGVSPLCKSNRASPYSYLQAETGRLEGNPELQQKVLNQLSKGFDDRVVIVGNEKPFIVETLIKKGLPVTLDSVLTAMQSENHQVLEMLLGHFNINKEPVTLDSVLTAMQSENHQVLEMLLGHFDINKERDAYFRYNETKYIRDPLALAIKMRDALAVRLLFQFGADKNQVVTIRRSKKVSRRVWKEETFNMIDYAMREKCNLQFQIISSFKKSKAPVGISVDTLAKEWHTLEGYTLSLTNEWNILNDILRMLGRAPKKNDCMDQDLGYYWRKFYFKKSTKQWKLSESK